MRVHSTAVMILGAASLHAQTESAVFRGSVLAKEGLVALPGVEVTIGRLDKRTTTNDSGRFEIRGIPAGSFEISVRRVGYAAQTTSLSFAAGQTVDREIVMQRLTNLDTVTVQASKIPSFDEHRRIGLGRFLTREQLAMRENSSLSEVLRDVPGVKVYRGRTGKTWVYSGRRQITSINAQGTGRGSDQLDPSDARDGAAAGLCYSQVYLDDTPLYRNATREPLVDINQFRVDAIESIEYYAGPASTPLKYSKLNSHCGVIVIHSRRR
jgi:hypothetical protein